MMPMTRLRPSSAEGDSTLFAFCSSTRWIQLTEGTESDQNISPFSSGEHRIRVLLNLHYFAAQKALEERTPPHRPPRAILPPTRVLICRENEKNAQVHGVAEYRYLPCPCQGEVPDKSAMKRSIRKANARLSTHS